MKVLLLGSGGREHALARALAADPAVTALYCAPGNPGIARHAQLVALTPVDPAAVADFAAAQHIDLVVIGPEAPLVAGVADELTARGILTFGPTKAAARLEGSKAFAKEIMAAAGVPTGDSRVASTLEGVRDAMDEFGPPYVIKDDGLAAGKGVVVTSDPAEALAHAEACLAAGSALVIEEFLDGPEVSLFCLSDGQNVVALAPAQDFKRALDGDEGPNTGGMGAYSPLPWAPSGLVDEVLENVARPVIREMAQRGTPFVGVLYCGLALTSRGVRVIEFNARFGDPETQVVLPRLATPLAGLLRDAAAGTLGSRTLEWRDGAAVCVVVAAENYPGTPVTGGAITGIEAAEEIPGVHVAQAGTAMTADGLVSSGGRVLCVVGEGHDLAEARDRAYAGAERIALAGSHFRTDIAASAVRGEVNA